MGQGIRDVIIPFFAGFGIGITTKRVGITGSGSNGGSESSSGSESSGGSESRDGSESSDGIMTPLQWSAVRVTPSGNPWDLNFSRTVAGITKWFWVTIEGHLSYLLPKFEDLIPTRLGDIAI